MLSDLTPTRKSSAYLTNQVVLYGSFHKIKFVMSYTPYMPSMCTVIYSLLE